MSEKDLVERLREWCVPSAFIDWEPDICHEAADEIERLRAEIELWKSRIVDR